MMANNDFIDSIEKVYSSIKNNNNQMISLWLKYTLFTWRWWLGVFASIAPWIVWTIFKKKNSAQRLLFVAFFVIIVSCWLDFFGVLTGLWSYYYNVVPLAPAFFPWDFTLLPVTVMAFLQFKPKFNPFIKSIIFSAITSFGAEPLLKWMDFYNPKQWHSYFSFPIFIVIYLVAHWISRGRSYAMLEDSRR